VTANTLLKIQTRRLEKEAVNSSRTRVSKAVTQAEYTQAHREVKRNLKKDKRDYIESLAEEAEKAAYQDNMIMKELYMITKKLAGKYCRPERPVKDMQGQTITDSEQQLERWAEHFSTDQHLRTLQTLLKQTPSLK
jgi:hypothetical protein